MWLNFTVFPGFAFVALAVGRAGGVTFACWLAEPAGRAPATENALGPPLEPAGRLTIPTIPTVAPTVTARTPAATAAPRIRAYRCIRRPRRTPCSMMDPTG